MCLNSSMENFRAGINAHALNKILFLKAKTIKKINCKKHLQYIINISIINNMNMFLGNLYLEITINKVIYKRYISHRNEILKFNFILELI